MPLLPQGSACSFNGFRSAHTDFNTVVLRAVLCSCNLEKMTTLKLWDSRGVASRMVYCFLVVMAHNGFCIQAFVAITALPKHVTVGARNTKQAERGKHLSSTPQDNQIARSQPIVALNVILRIKPEAREQFLEVILNNQRGTMDKTLEPLALEYTFGEDGNEPNTFHFHEKYMGENGIEAHNAAPHFMVWEKFAQTDPFTAPPEVYKFTIYQD
jgi:quinol monooxygenase YgiN